MAIEHSASPDATRPPTRNRYIVGTLKRKCNIKKPKNMGLVDSQSTTVTRRWQTSLSIHIRGTTVVPMRLTTSVAHMDSGKRVPLLIYIDVLDESDKAPDTDWPVFWLGSRMVALVHFKANNREQSALIYHTELSEQISLQITLENPDVLRSNTVNVQRQNTSDFVCDAFPLDAERLAVEVVESNAGLEDKGLVGQSGSLVDVELEGGVDAEQEASDVTIEMLEDPYIESSQSPPRWILAFPA